MAGVAVTRTQSGEYAWVPYSRYQVGSAVLTSDGRIVAGCNVENASYGLTTCAERAALYGSRSGLYQLHCDLCFPFRVPVPCGACRQFLVEFNKDMLVVLGDVNHAADTPPELIRLDELLPRVFKLL